ncbi:MAG: DEAD/DEAH box helicase [Chlamydiota bacterium]
MEKPDCIQTYIHKFSSLSIGEIIFSEGTYEIEVKKGSHSYWLFLQINDDGKILDWFCTCDFSEKEKGCEHLAFAYTHICTEKKPLHVRFRLSFWNHLCQIACRHLGFTKKEKRKEKKIFFEGDHTKKVIFSISSDSNKEKLLDIFSKKKVETEETSLKFSNLSLEELALWRKGKGSFRLLYELSFWSDLAKFLFQLGEKKPYRIQFVEPGENLLPTKVKVRMHTLELTLCLEEKDWLFLIPSLCTVTSPLQVYANGQERIKAIFYDKEKAIFSLEQKGGIRERKKEAGILVGDWYYYPNEGFYPRKEDPLFEKSVIPNEKISQALTLYHDIFHQFLQNAKIQEDPLTPNYQIFFDENWSLHIKTYLFTFGDLEKQYSQYFGPWVYLDGVFYQLKEEIFCGRELVISKAELSEFVSQHKVFLNRFPSFQTHLGKISMHFTYRLESNLSLQFLAKWNISEDFIDFGDWIYICDKGFYQKGEDKGILLSFLEVKKEDISSFISRYKEELESVEGFFTTALPIRSSGLHVFFNEDSRIVIQPKILLDEKYNEGSISFFENYGYLENEGFFEIPSPFRLPLGYRNSKVISLSEESVFFEYEIKKIQPFIISIDPRLLKPKFFFLRLNSLSKTKRRGIEYWVLDLVYEADKKEVSCFDIWKGMQEKKKYVISAGGLIDLTQARFQWIRPLKKHRFRKDKKLCLTTLEMIRLDIFESFERGKSPESEKAFLLLEKLRSFSSVEEMNISDLQANLRPYQEKGLQWLWFLYCHGLSGLLADEMGLGKTHQAMALLAGISHEDKERNFRYLVVCPTSVIYHWQELLEKFLPHLRVYTYHGLSRSLDNVEYDLLLTSYGILRSEVETLTHRPYELAIFDEMQIAKNHTSKTYRALKKIEAKMRLGLTGTPIENRIRELKSIFDLLLPYYLPPESTFRELFVIPIEKNQDMDKKELLRNVIKPFILRRKKVEVLLDLPEKIEEIAFADLSDEQKILYKDAILSSKSSILPEIGDPKKSIPYLHIFSLFSRLKQICDHPSLVLHDIKNFTRHSSGKWDLFVELLEEALDSDQKIVVFSQYLEMIGIITSYLQKKKIGFASIIGATRDRLGEMKRFREDPNCRVFVASLLAAGVGIDLTSGSVVIHYDRWWNSAKENQATDRVHRIGQTRGVQVFKFITKNTIEEHIHQLIEKKKGFLEEIIQKEEGDEIRLLSREELYTILQQMTQRVEEW